MFQVQTLADQCCILSGADTQGHMALTQVTLLERMAVDQRAMKRWGADGALG